MKRIVATTDYTRCISYFVTESQYIDIIFNEVAQKMMKNPEGRLKMVYLNKDS
jgi:hypothetical protein